MSEETIVIEGVVLPGPTLAPPYATGERCVLWLAAGDTDEEANGGGIPFQLRADDGRELRIECAGAYARLPVRLRISYDHLPGAPPPRWRGIDGERPHSPRGRPQPIRGNRLVAWLAVGDRLRLRGHLFESAPFRGVETVRAHALQVDGEPFIRSPSLAEAEAEA